MNHLKNMMNRRIAVIMSIYKNDSVDHVSLAVNSILTQTHRELDFYIVYDGPVSSEIDAFFSQLHDIRIHLTKRQVNKGLAYSLNELLDATLPQGYEFIARMDADDIAVDNRFAKQIEFLQANPQVDMVGGAINEIDEQGNNRGKITSYPTNPDECRAFFAKRNPVAHPTVMFRRSFFEKAGSHYPTDFERNEDTRLWHEGYKHGAVIANIPDVILNFRMTDQMFKQRRNGKEFAKSQLTLRKLIAKDLNYGMMAQVYAYAMYILMISPSWVLKLAYKVLR